MKNYLALFSIIAFLAGGFDASAQVFDPNAGNRPDVVSPPPQINPDAPICVLTPIPDEHACPSDEDDARNWVIIINQFACSGQCDLGAVELRMNDSDRNLISRDAAFDIQRPSTRTVSFGTRFTGEGVIFEAAFVDQSFVMTTPIALSAADHGITRLQMASVTFRSGRTALISFSFTPYRVRP